MIKCKSVTVTDEILTKLNEFTRREHTAEEVYIFSVILCDNEIDRDGERFTDSALEKLAQLFVGKTGVFDHNPSTANQNARIFDTVCITDETVKTSYGENYTYVKALAYMIKTEKNADLIREIEGGIKKEVSISCSVSKQYCSICGADLREGLCDHRKGKSYQGNVCATILDEPTDAYEWSFVAVPAQRNAGVTKAFTASNMSVNEKLYNAQKGISLTATEVRELKAMLSDYDTVKKDAKEYRSELEAEVIRLAFIASPYIPSEIMADSIKGLDTEKLKSLRDAYKTETSSPWVQIKKQENKDNSNFVL